MRMVKIDADVDVDADAGDYDDDGDDYMRIYYYDLDVVMRTKRDSRLEDDVAVRTVD